MIETDWKLITLTPRHSQIQKKFPSAPLCRRYGTAVGRFPHTDQNKDDRTSSASSNTVHYNEVLSTVHSKVFYRCDVDKSSRNVLYKECTFLHMGDCTEYGRRNSRTSPDMEDRD